jgi:hypothetical protein
VRYDHPVPTGWLIRRSGLLSFAAVWLFADLLFMPLQVSGWLGQFVILVHAVPLVIAAWRLFVIMSDDHNRALATAV